MDFKGLSEMNRKQDVYAGYIGSVFPIRGFSSDFHRLGISKHLVNVRTPFHKERDDRWPVMEESDVKRPSFLRLDSQGQSSESDWIYTSSTAAKCCSGNVQTSSLFSDVFHRFVDTHDKQSMAGRYCVSEPLKTLDRSLNIMSSVTQFCQKENSTFPCQWNTASTASSVDFALSNLGSLQYWTKFMPVCASKTKTIPHTCQKPVESVYSLQLQSAEQCFQDLPYDFHFSLFRNLTPVRLPFVVDLTDCMSTFKDDWLDNSVKQQSIVTAGSSNTVNDSSNDSDSRLLRNNRQPRYNCRRRFFRNNPKRPKRARHVVLTCSSGVNKNTTMCELVQSDSDSSSECTDIYHDNECIGISGDGKQAVSQYCSPIRNSVNSCNANDTVWVNQCYSQLPLPSSLYGVQETHVQESCSFASLFFASGEEVDNSDICSFISDDSEFSGILSSSPICQTDNVLADALLSNLPCLHTPFTDNWVIGFGDCSPPSFDHDFEVYFDDCSTTMPSEDIVCEYSLRVPDANTRWNEAYSFPVDVLLETTHRHSRMVHFSTDVSMVTVLNWLEWADDYQEARCGPWEQFARDRERFLRRVHEVDSQISWVLNPEHRATKYQYLQNCTLSTENSSSNFSPS